MTSPSPPKRVLLLTNSEHGQANVFLATAHALLTLDDDEGEDVEVHFASFAPIRKHVASTSDYALLSQQPQATGRRRRPIVFHQLAGRDMMSAWSRPEFEAESDGSRHGQGLAHAWRRMQVLLQVTLPWTGPEFVEVFESVAAVVGRVRPHVTAVDPAFSPGLTAARALGIRYLVLAPNSVKDFAVAMQPLGEALWKFPCLGSSFTYPIPTPLIPLNIALVLFALLVSLLDPHRRALQRHVTAHLSSTPSPSSPSSSPSTTRLVTLTDLSLGPPPPSSPDGRRAKVLVAGRPELDFPLRLLPAHIVPLGPVVRPAPPLSEADPALAAWLARGPAVYVNLGTHVAMGAAGVGEMALALRAVLEFARGWGQGKEGMAGLRVLWKLSVDREDDEKEEGGGGTSCSWREVLGPYVEDGSVRVVRWVEAEPSAVLAAGTVVCAVHHGGANSFSEAVSAGVPQVVLPVWMDTFDFARRVELLGIGRWGNKVGGHRGSWGGELGNALIEVLMGGQADAMRERARQLAELCRENGGGRVLAARMILKEIGDEVVGAEEEDDGASWSSGSGTVVE